MRKARQERAGGLRAACGGGVAAAGDKVPARSGRRVRRPRRRRAARPRPGPTPWISVDTVRPGRRRRRAVAAFGAARSERRGGCARSRRVRHARSARRRSSGRGPTERLRGAVQRQQAPARRIEQPLAPAGWRELRGGCAMSASSSAATSACRQSARSASMRRSRAAVRASSRRAISGCANGSSEVAPRPRARRSGGRYAHAAGGPVDVAPAQREQLALAQSGHGGGEGEPLVERELDAP